MGQVNFNAHALRHAMKNNMNLLPCLSASCLLMMAATVSVQAADDLTVANFKGNDYGAWKTTGDAFGAGPEDGCASSNHGGGVSTGTLTSPEFTIQRGYINMRIQGGNFPDDLQVQLMVDGKAVRRTSGSHQTNLFWFSWDVLDLKGSKASFLVTDNNTNKDWGYLVLGDIEQSDVRKGMNEMYRPQFHITAQWGHINDPNGMYYNDGEYHIMHQWSPQSLNHGQKHWGHLVSTDLIHWRPLNYALTPTGGWAGGGADAYSGSAVVDKNNTAGFKTGREDPIILIYTAIRLGQYIAYSNDRGRTFTPWAGNPVLPPGGLEKMNRDPMVRWQASAGPHGQWVMVLPEWDGTTAAYAFYGSDDLKTWKKLDDSYKHHGDCPDYFQLPVDGNPANMKWLMHGAGAGYWLGEFNGTTFVDAKEYPEGTLWRGPQYATQTINDAPNGRKIMMAWVVTEKKQEPAGMPYSQMLSFPVDIKLKTFPEGLRAVATPIPEIALLHKAKHSWKNETIVPGSNLLGKLHGDLFEIKAEFGIGSATEFGFRIRGKGIVSYNTTDKQARLNGEVIQGNNWNFNPDNGKVTMQILVDRSIIEAFYDGGRAYLMSPFYPEKANRSLELFSTGGDTRLLSLDVYELQSAWDRPLWPAALAAPQKTNETPK
jgi:sucrose-6-phosphate hydrolase SacC (GH32 family)